MTDICVYVDRMLTRVEASAIVGERIPDNLTPTIKAPALGDTVRVIDNATGELIALVTRMSELLTAQLRVTVTGTRVDGSSGRTASMLENAGAAKIFGWMPKKVFRRREACSPALLAATDAEANLFLSNLGGVLGRQFRKIAPDIAAHDLDIMRAVDRGWLMEEESLWTSGVINKTSQLPYHRDVTNFPTWSAMPTVRFRMRGGHLHLPEYNIVFPCGDGEVTWFCGKELVHGVTPMWTKGADAYRYSVVYYALKGMKDCGTVAEETTQAAERRSAREKLMAELVRNKLTEAS